MANGLKLNGTFSQDDQSFLVKRDMVCYLMYLLPTYSPTYLPNYLLTYYPPTHLYLLTYTYLFTYL
jgi:hypothetical protein